MHPIEAIIGGKLWEKVRDMFGGRTIYIPKAGHVQTSKRPKTGRTKAWKRFIESLKDDSAH